MIGTLIALKLIFQRCHFYVTVFLVFELKNCRLRTGRDLWFQFAQSINSVCGRNIILGKATDVVKSKRKTKRRSVTSYSGTNKCSPPTNHRYGSYTPFEHRNVACAQRIVK